MKNMKMSKEDEDLARKVIDKIRKYHRMKIPGWKARLRNNIFMLLRPKLEMWIYLYFSKRFIKLDMRKKLSLTYELFVNVLEKFRPDKSRTPVKNFFINMHRLITYELVALHRKWIAEKNYRNEDVDPDDLPDGDGDSSGEMTFEFHEFLRGLETEDEEIQREVKKILEGDYEKFSGNVYKFAKERTHRMWFHLMMRYLCTKHKWGGKE